MLIDEEFTLKKLEIFLAFMRTGNLARAAAELQTSNVSVHLRALRFYDCCAAERGASPLTTREPACYKRRRGILAGAIFARSCYPSSGS